MSNLRTATRGGGGRGGGSGSRSEQSQGSVSRLERAVDELVTTTREHVSDRAAAVIDETTRRLERELGRRRDGANPGSGDRYPGDRYPGGGDPDDALGREIDAGVARKLYRDPKREKIGGVCAGIARYYGMEPWVVRCIAVTALLFFPTIVFPAYWIAYFVMDKPPKDRADHAREGQRRRHGAAASPSGLVIVTYALPSGCSSTS